MQRRIAMVTLIIVGLAMIVATLALQMFSRAPAFENMTTDFSRNVKPATIAALRTDVADLRAGGTELQTTGLAALAQLLGMSQEQFATAAQQQFPALTSAIQAIPQTTQNFDSLLSVMAAQDAHLQSAVAIPTKSISTAVLPWLIVGAGILSIVIGVMMSTRAAGLAAMTLGALILIGIFVCSLPSKSSDADALNKAIKPYFTQQQIDTAGQAVTGLNAMSQELIGKVLPAVAAAQHVDAATLQTQFAAQFPALTRAMVALPDATARFSALSSTFQRNLANFKKVEPFKLAFATWALVGAGILIMLGGAVPMVWSGAAAAGGAGKRVGRAA
ncbi:MAG: hypothetical protein ACXVQS_11075 [Actinomycetota bacterium]